VLNNNIIIVVVVVIIVVVIVFLREIRCKRQNYVNENAEDENDLCLAR